MTYESVKHKNIHVIGDSTIGLPVPKSGNIANAMEKICALAIVHLLNGKEVPPEGSDAAVQGRSSEPGGRDAQGPHEDDSG